MHIFSSHLYINVIFSPLTSQVLIHCYGCVEGVGMVGIDGGSSLWPPCLFTLSCLLIVIIHLWDRAGSYAEPRNELFSLVHPLGRIERFYDVLNIFLLLAFLHTTSPFLLISTVHGSCAETHSSKWPQFFRLFVHRLRLLDQSQTYTVSAYPGLIEVTEGQLLFWCIREIGSDVGVACIVCLWLLACMCTAFSLDLCYTGLSVLVSSSQLYSNYISDAIGEPLLDERSSRERPHFADI